jgi:uncharacterized membrane protein YgcG
MALIGNPMDFDRIRRTYESITYPESRKTFQTPFEQTRSQYSGLLTGTGSETIRQDAAQPGEQIQFRFNPVTGQTETVIPEYMGTYRTDQTDFFPGSSPFQSIYSTGDSEIDPGTGQIKETEPELSIESLSSVIPRGDGQQRLNQMSPLNFGQLASSVQSFDPKKQAMAGLLGLVTGTPFGTVAGLAKQIGKAQLSNLGVKSNIAIGQLADSYNQAIKSGLSPQDALTEATLTSGTTLNKKAFTQAGIEELSIDDMLSKVKDNSQGDGGSGQAGGKSGGTAGGSAGPGGAGGRAKGGKYT